MNPKLAGWRSLVVAGLASAAVPAIAGTEVSMPAEQYQGPVGYVTGGVGQAEAKLFEQRASDHALAIELVERARQRDEFTAYAMVKISDQHGHTVLNAKAQGPFMLVDLAPGRYAIQARFERQTLTKPSVVVAAEKTARAYFEFSGHPMAGVHLSQAEGGANGGLGG
jgi:hypothetical protein